MLIVILSKNATSTEWKLNQSIKNQINEWKKYKKKYFLLLTWQGSNLPHEDLCPC